MAVRHIRGSRGDRMNQLGLTIHPDMRLHAEVSLVAFLRLMHLRIPLLSPVLCRTGRTDDGRIHDGPPVHLQAVLRQMRPDPGKELRAQLVGFQ